MNNTDKRTDLGERLTDPRAVYAEPDAVLADDSLSSREKERVLMAWKEQETRLVESGDEGMPPVGSAAPVGDQSGGEVNRLPEVNEALDKLETDSLQDLEARLDALSPRLGSAG
jgi:hypothetical protein